VSVLRLRVVALASALALAGCVSLPPQIGDCRGPLVPVELIPGGDFVLRERLRVQAPDVDLRLDLVAERRGERLVLIAFDAFGAQAFHVEQHGLEVTSHSDLGRALALPPENALRDLHAARFVGPDTGGRVEVSRPGCGYTASFVRIERRALDRTTSPDA